MDTKDAGRMGGLSKSKAKQEAARVNGKRGGRPKKTYTMEERVWTTKDGKELEISRMETSHIVNALQMIESRAKKGAEIVVSYGYAGDDNYMTGDVVWVEGDEYLARVEEYTWLKEELQRRK